MIIRYKIVCKDRTSLFTDPPYKFKYIKGKIITAKDETFGIFTFKTLIDVEKFSSFSLKTNISVLKVRPIGRGKVPKLISRYITSRKISNFYKDSYPSLFNIMSPPQGTICYKSVEVLE